MPAQACTAGARDRTRDSRCGGVERRRYCRALAALLVVAALPVPASRAMEWRDGAGRVQYSDRPPPPACPRRTSSPGRARPRDLRKHRCRSAHGAGATAALPVPAAAASSASAASAAACRRRPEADPELEARRRRPKRAEAAKQKAEDDKLAAARADNCQRATGAVRTLEDGMRIARVNAKGEREILDDKTRAAEAKRARGVIVSDCR